MRVLLDNCVNHRFADHLAGWDVVHVRQLGWADLTNGRLLTTAQENGFDVLLTVDKSVRKQQNLAGRQISLITLNAYSILLEDLVPFVPEIEHNLRNLTANLLGGQDILISLS
jgi:predicted nuclease of predicted toxin-antitoxin system